jgi:hypothetical protein
VCAQWQQQSRHCEAREQEVAAHRQHCRPVEEAQFTENDFREGVIAILPIDVISLTISVIS